MFSFQGELLNPCRCDGSVRYTHQLCLLKWISERGSWTCELCCYRYHVTAIKMKQPCQVNCCEISFPWSHFATKHEDICIHYLRYSIQITLKPRFRICRDVLWEVCNIFIWETPKPFLFRWLPLLIGCLWMKLYSS